MDAARRAGIVRGHRGECYEIERSGTGSDRSQSARIANEQSHAHTVGRACNPDRARHGASGPAGLKVTPQRQLLFRCSHGNTSHPTAEALYTRREPVMPGISLRTVYQTLTDLAAMGELQSLSSGVRRPPVRSRTSTTTTTRLRRLRRRSSTSTSTVPTQLVPTGARRLRRQFHLDRVPRHLRRHAPRAASIDLPASNIRPPTPTQGDNPC